MGDKLIDWNWKHTFALETGPDASHINLKEFRALRLALRRKARGGPSARGKRYICLNDSRVVVGAVAHGRSSSKALNRGLRSLLPLLIGSNLYPTMLWVPTGANSADVPSRAGCLARWLRAERAAAKSRRR